jgi:hypothetical protein
MEGPRPGYQSRLEPLHDLAEVLGPAWDSETDPEARGALAGVLEFVHRSLQEHLRPDETAEGRAFAAARGRDPAANHNAQSIVIHSLHRAGAPGIDPPLNAGVPTPSSKPAPPATAVAAPTQLPETRARLAASSSAPLPEKPK